jgi:hypothetical protein
MAFSQSSQNIAASETSPQHQDYRVLVRGPKARNTIVLRSKPCNNIYEKENAPELKIHHSYALEEMVNKMRPDESKYHFLVFK